MANPSALQAIGAALESPDDTIRLYAISTIWALIYDNQKAKAAVKALIAAGEIKIDAFSDNPETFAAPLADDSAEHAMRQVVRLLS